MKKFMMVGLVGYIFIVVLCVFNAVTTQEAGWIVAALGWTVVALKGIRESL